MDYIKGWGKLSGPNSVAVNLSAGGSQVVEGKNIILAVGSEVTPLPTAPVDNAGQKVVDSTGALELAKIPAKMIVIGGVFGYDYTIVGQRNISKFHENIEKTKDEIYVKYQGYWYRSDSNWSQTYGAAISRW